MRKIVAPLSGTVVSIRSIGASIARGDDLAVIESMKMEHVVRAGSAGVIDEVLVSVGELVDKGQNLVAVSDPAPNGSDRNDASGDDENEATPDAGIRADLAESVARHDIGLDAARPTAVSKRRALGRRTARENVAHLVDRDSFIEFGPLAIASQRRRREVADLIENTPADGLVGGLATINAAHFGVHATECVVASYDYTVLAGTQGMTNHRKKDRLFELADRRRLPVVVFTEGGGGRPGDVDTPGVSWLDCLAFALFGRLAGRVPLIGINAGFCFAGNAALLGTCDVVIATEDSNIGMAGPAMIDGGGLGVVSPNDIGPSSVHVTNDVIDILVTDESEATDVARTLIGFTQGSTDEWSEPRGRSLRDVIPENRKRVYDMRELIEGLVDADSSVELRAGQGEGMIAAFARIEGRSIALLANNPLHLAGAIDHDGARKAAWFLEMCESWRVPVLFLCDTPGFMVGPDSDAAGLPRSAGALFRLGGNLSVPFGTVITRKGYGLGAQAMAGGGFKQPLFTVSWPTGEFGPMGLEGAVELGFSTELAAAATDVERQTLFDELVDEMYEHGKAVNVASHFEIDDVIDPADTRRWVSRLLKA